MAKIKRLEMQPTSVIKMKLGIQPGGPVHKFFTAECAKAMDKFVPFDEGNLAGTVIQNGEPTENVHDTYIVYDQEYAHYQWAGVSKNGNKLNYQKDKHHLATDHWDEKMVTADGDKITRHVQEYMKTHGGNK